MVEDEIQKRIIFGMIFNQSCQWMNTNYSKIHKGRDMKDIKPDFDTNIIFDAVFEYYWKAYYRNWCIFTGNVQTKTLSEESQKNNDKDLEGWE